MPAMPASGLVVGKAEFGFGGLEGVLDRPAPPFDLDQHRHRRSLWTPCREEGHFPVAQAAPDQQAACPHRRRGATVEEGSAHRDRPAPDRPSRKAVVLWSRRRRTAEPSARPAGLPRSPRPCRTPAPACPRSGTASCSRRRARIPCPPGATPSPPRRRRRHCPPPPRRTAPRHRSPARSSRPRGCGLVANLTSSGTWAAARRSGSPVQALGR